jgi:ribosomal protein S18 acetylase RimI-like enzyme
VDHEIAAMRIEDYEAVRAFWGAQPGLGLGASDTREGVAGCLARNPGLSFVARAGEDVVGAVLCGHDGRRGALYHLAVAPAHRRCGLGRTLVQRCLDGLRAAGIQRCNIFVYADNEPALRFWTSLGFETPENVTFLQRRV